LTLIIASLRRLNRRAPVVTTGLSVLACAVPLLLCGCHDTHPLYGPDTPRNGEGTAVDATLGTPLPGAPEGNHGM
jgi:hypothetical protein